MMNVLFFGSELDKGTLEIAGQLKGRLAGMRLVSRDDANGLLGIEDGDVILDVAPGMDQPRLIRKEELVNGSATTMNGEVLGPFLKKMEKIGRLRDIKVIGIPMQVDDNVVSNIGRLLKEMGE